MTSNLDRLALIIKARTLGPWRFSQREGWGVSYPRLPIGNEGHVCHCFSDNYADGKFIAALGSCADELLQVVQAGEIAVEQYGTCNPECSPEDKWECFSCRMARTLAALDARLAAVLPGGES